MKIKLLYENSNAGRTILDSTLHPEIKRALLDLSSSTSSSLRDEKPIIIGGLAVSFWSRPRMTMDIDVLVNSVPNKFDWPGFRKNRPHSMEHKTTGVEVETLTKEYIGLDHDLVQLIRETAVESDGLLVASAEGIIALKTNRWSRQDQADVEALIRAGVTIRTYEHFIPHTFKHKDQLLIMFEELTEGDKK